MLKLLLSVTLAAALAASTVVPTFAQTTAPAKSEKSEKAAKSDTKADTKAAKEPKQLTAQQLKMKDCGAKWQDEKKAKDVSGRTAYQKFLSTCLKSNSAT